VDGEDSWLRFPDATDFYAKKGDGNVVYPKGAQNHPWPNGAGSDGWFKIFQNSEADWTWSTLTSDDDPHEIYVQFDAPGSYTMEISGRSKGHLLDRIVLSKEVPNATDPSLDETPCGPAKTLAPILSIENSSAIEGQNIEVVLSLSKTSSETIVLDIEFFNYTAGSEDYFSGYETITF
jgi:hypothetical protein